MSMPSCFRRSFSIKKKTMSNKFKYSSSQSNTWVDPCKEEEACLLREGLIYPQNPALHIELDKKRFSCYQCGKWFDSKAEVRNHLQTKHLRDFRTKDELAPLPRWHCTKCRKEFGCRPKSDGSVSHFCKPRGAPLAEWKTDILDETNDLKRCAVYSPNSPMEIKRVRFECRCNADLLLVEHWLENELSLHKSGLRRSDYLDAAKMFIAVKGYQMAIELLEKSMEIEHEESEQEQVHDCDEQTLIDVASQLMKKSKR